MSTQLFLNREFDNIAQGLKLSSKKKSDCRDQSTKIRNPLTSKGIAMALTSNHARGFTISDDA